MSFNILVVDDEKDMLALLSRYITEETDYQVTTENDPLNAQELFKKESFDLVIMDLKMPRMGGLDLLRRIKKIRPDTSAIIMTAYATIETAVEAIQEGAYDYITKPFRRERILLTIDKALQWRRMIFENMALREELGQKDAVRPLIGSSDAIKSVIQEIKQVAPTTATVLITGPSGTGKELAARALHHFSLRKSHPMVTVNCTAISENVIESELFGHVKGAFTGAWKDKKDWWRKRTAAPCFWMKSGTWAFPCRPNCCACSRKENTSPWAVPAPAGRTSGLWRPPIMIWKRT